ncbi:MULTISPECIES: hypothetical protein [unclassified Microbacterium]|uniref:hypothetical protein n=1 Tax=unclassified Microbacterium TaxID=2609290 RepID=UPI000CFDC6CF|nr:MULTISPECIES: hypothetical protein [unclassified Microbacterium]PQZ53517.1 hypothetical protein CQ032_15255 [Microbacterium sp. MYb43]PQZ75119.1 hypothetical protein CQ031_14605 [Microbacterium sp. MYb40]PRB19414.1 hypothetical protein CQ040_15905 [Microbacterium sp. MYb54]PRB24615.1 hypothetical protein CQ037_16410 [Microbacterium sp. MYb50]PRB63726.1 hypothetical protein CQ021_16015 [Microbacterium sp. MYb24]
MRSKVHHARTTLGPVTLRNWDVILGKGLRDLWSSEGRPYGLDDTSPVCFRTGELTDWAVRVYAEKDAGEEVVSPSEHLNIEGARLARFLSAAGWTGRGYVLNTTVPTFERLCGSLSAAGAGPMAGVGVSSHTRSGDGGIAWTIDLSVWR